jgi:hypothetical protein
MWCLGEWGDSGAQIGFDLFVGTIVPQDPVCYTAVLRLRLVACFTEAQISRFSVEDSLPFQ